MKVTHFPILPCFYIIWLRSSWPMVLKVVCKVHYNSVHNYVCIIWQIASCIVCHLFPHCQYIQQINTYPLICLLLVLHCWILGTTCIQDIVFRSCLSTVGNRCVEHHHHMCVHSKIYFWSSALQWSWIYSNYSTVPSLCRHLVWQPYLPSGPFADNSICHQAGHQKFLV